MLNKTILANPFTQVYHRQEYLACAIHGGDARLPQLLEDIAAGKQARSYLDHAQVLQEAIEQQIRWEPLRAAWQAIKDCCAIS